VALLLFAAPMVLIARRRLGFAVLLSLSIYVVSLVFSLNLPLWPQDGHWRFNPLCWQFIFMLGLASGELSDGKLDPWLPTLRSFGIPIAAIGFDPSTQRLGPGELRSPLGECFQQHGSGSAATR
jgi:hypothetical protein